jgi:hypothetical protein
LHLSVSQVSWTDRKSRARRDNKLRLTECRRFRGLGERCRRFLDCLSRCRRFRVLGPPTLPRSAQTPELLPTKFVVHGLHQF